MDIFDDISFQTSKLVTKAYSTSFSIAVSFLDEEMQRSIYGIYGFVRFADEIVDTFQHVDQKQALDQFERDYYHAAATGMSLNPILHSFALTVKKYGIPPHLIEAFLKSMRADLNKHLYCTSSELDEYIYGSADVVGLMCLMVFVNGDQQMYAKLEKPAMKLGSAFQKVNFLRDLKSDIELLDRRYFPQLSKDTFDESAKNCVIKEIESDFSEAMLGVQELPGRSRLAVLIAYTYYLQLLKKLKDTPADQIMQSRIRVSDTAKLLLLGKAYLKYQFGN